MLNILFVATGGALGSVARYLLGSTLQRHWGAWFPDTYLPVGTLVVNVIGCLVIGVLSAIMAGPWEIRDEIRLGLMVGLLGGFTTFSAIGLESFMLMQEGQRLAGGANIVVSCILGVAAVALGHSLTARMLG